MTNVIARHDGEIAVVVGSAAGFHAFSAIKNEANNGMLQLLSSHFRALTLAALSSLNDEFVNGAKNLAESTQKRASNFLTSRLKMLVFKIILLLFEHCRRKSPNPALHRITKAENLLMTKITKSNLYGAKNPGKGPQIRESNAAGTGARRPS